MPIDNVDVNGNAIATDNIDGNEYQIIKVAFGDVDLVQLVADATNKRLPVTGPVSLSAAIPAGTNNIGDVDILTLPGSLSGFTVGVAYASQTGMPVGGVRQDTAAALSGVADGDMTIFTFDSLNRLRVATLAALATTDTISAKMATDKIMDNKTELTPKFFKANIAASQTNSSLVALVASKKIRVLAFRLFAGGTATNVTFRSGTSADISETFALDARGPMNSGFSPVGHFETVSGEALTVTTGAGATTGIGGVYVEV